MKDKLTSLYSDHDMNGLTLQYIDDENERVTFSTDEELRAAIELNKGTNSLKIYALGRSTGTATTVTEQETSMNDESSDEIPEEIRFDHLNNGHSVSRKSKTRSSTNTFHSHGSPHAASSQNHWQNHFRVHKSHHRRHGPSNFVPQSHFLQHVQAQIPQWLPNREHAAHVSEHIRDHLAAWKTNTQSYMQNSKEYLENVGQYLQQALSPFGIDCDYHVDEQGKTSKTETTTSTQTTTKQSSESHAMETNSSTEPNVTETEITEAASSSGVDTIEKNIEFCLAKLKGMGFNENEALNDLVRSKNGDINAVLDAINPRRN